MTRIISGSPFQVGVGNCDMPNLYYLKYMARFVIIRKRVIIGYLNIILY